MKAICWHGKKDIRVDNVPDPQIINEQDAIIRVTASAICGSDLHLYNGLMPTMESGDVLGHEFMGKEKMHYLKGKFLLFLENQKSADSNPKKKTTQSQGKYLERTPKLAPVKPSALQ